MIDPDTPMAAKLGALPKIGVFYGGWYPTRWLGWGRWPRYSEFGSLATHLRFVERSARRLARASFHGMLRYQAKLQNKQAFLFRLVDVANELFAIAATVTRAHALGAQGRPEAAEARRLADAFCRMGRRRVHQLFAELWDNDDVQRYRVGAEVLDGKHAWLERGILNLSARPTVAAAPPVPDAEGEAKKVAVGVS
ncbi:MAG TPA: acyl-CoA dehydrogenase, partial [Vicinamibacteria bacterium]|nr:acyl-CoA dehydrogenase [Vicinamibacteria bacterium]